MLDDWRPGTLGMLILPMTILIGHLIGRTIVRSLGGLHPLGNVTSHAITIISVSGVFWFWASYKLLAKGDPDLGCVSFFISGVAAYRTADLSVVHIKRSRRSPRSLLQMRLALPVSCVIVLLNHAVVLVLMRHVLPPTFMIYLAMGSVCWLGFAMRSAWLFCDDEAVVALLRDEARVVSKGLCRAAVDEEAAHASS